MKTILPVLAAAILLLSSCASVRRYQPAVEQPDFTTVVYTHGQPSLQSQLNGAEITADLSVRGNRDMTLGLQVHNAGLKAFDFAPEGVRIYGIDAAGNRVPFQVLSAEQVIRRNRNRALLLGGALVATTAVAVAVAASHDDGDHNHHHHHDDQPCYSAYDPAADFWFAAVTVPALAVQSAALAAPVPAPTFTTPPDGLLRRHTLFPEETLQGVVKIRAQAEFLTKILVEVPVEGGFAQFAFDRRTKRF